MTVPDREAVRLDVAVVQRGLLPSRSRAASVIRAGDVRVGERVVRRPAEPVTAGERIELAAGVPVRVSRAAQKLEGALDAMVDAAGRAVRVDGRRCLDAGASTGGFTEVLLQRGAQQVVAVDVGHGQLAASLRADGRVASYEGCNVRTLTPERIGGPVQLAVADLSFISLTTVLPALLGCLDADGDVVPMVKPQFEVGRRRLGRGGVVRDNAERVQAAVTVAQTAAALGWGAVAAADSVLPGPAGNREIFLWLRRDAPRRAAAGLTQLVTQATERNGR